MAYCLVTMKMYEDCLLNRMWRVQRAFQSRLFQRKYCRTFREHTQPRDGAFLHVYNNPSCSDGVALAYPPGPSQMHGLLDSWKAAHYGVVASRLAARRV